MSAMPFYSVMTQNESMRSASSGGKALMFASGETGTAGVSLPAALYAWQSGIPGGGIHFWVTPATIRRHWLSKSEAAGALVPLRLPHRFLALPLVQRGHLVILSHKRILMQGLQRHPHLNSYLNAT